jgi:GxxExxY protein
MLKKEGYELMGAAFEVYNELGPGFLEEVYQEALERELASRQIPFVAQHPVQILYKGSALDKKYKPDFFVYESIIVELKACKALAPDHEAQLLNYLKATGLPVGYLINFGYPTELEWKRMILTQSSSAKISEN